MLWNVLSLGGFVMGRFVRASLYVWRKCNQLWSQLVAYLFIGTWEFTNSRKATTQVIKIAWGVTCQCSDWDEAKLCSNEDGGLNWLWHRWLLISSAYLHYILVFVPAHGVGTRDCSCSPWRTHAVWECCEPIGWKKRVSMPVDRWIARFLQHIRELCG
jgi:hypothetical protein